MAIRKNTRRFDPRYFMDEKTENLNEGLGDAVRKMMGKPRPEDLQNFEMGRDGMRFLENYIRDIRDGNFKPTLEIDKVFFKGQEGNVMKQAINPADLNRYWDQRGDELEKQNITETIIQTIINMLHSAGSYIDRQVALVIDAIGDGAPSDMRAAGFQGASKRSGYSKMMSKK